MIRRWLSILRLREATFLGRLLRICVLGACLFIGMLAVLPMLETRLIFGGWVWDLRKRREPYSEMNVVEIDLRSEAGDRIHGWWSAPTGWRPEDGAVLYSHGAGGDLTQRRGFCQRLRRRLHRVGVLLFDYPGYGRSTGTPSEQGCYAAAEAAWNWLRQGKGVRERDIVLIGESLGGGVATEMAIRHPSARMLVLLATFTSIPDMAETLVPWVPGSRNLIRNRFDNLAKLPNVTMPVLIAHGTADGLVPLAQAKKLYVVTTAPKRLIVLEGQGHSGPQGSREVFVALRDFLP